MINKKLDNLKKYVDRRAEQVIGWDVLEKKIKSGQTIKIKYGADATKPDLHIGHAVAIKLMRKFQDELGANVQFLIGDFTSRIGDPTGNSKVRKVITEDEIKSNAFSYADQVFKILDKEKTEVWSNGTKLDFVKDCRGGWWDEMPLAEFLSLLSIVTHSKLIDRDMFQKRISENKEIYMHEMMYPILQGYDSVKMESDLTIVGSDQLFNELMGRFYQEKFDQVPQAIITLPILVGTDGKEKMSKSLGNYIGLNDSSNDMYGKTMSIPDETILNWVLYASNLDYLEIKNMLDNGENPRNVKALLAFDIVRQYWSEDKAQIAQEEFVNMFKNKENPEDMMEIELEDRECGLVDLMVANQMVSSKSDARRMIEQGAVKLNNERIDNINYKLVMSDGEKILKVGKRKFLRLKYGKKN